MITVERSLASWLPADTPAIQLAIVKRALLDIGICEIPPGSNRSGRIDEYCRAAGAPVGSYWCAAALYVWWREAGADVPPLRLGPASCDTWMHWAMRERLWQLKPIPGAAVVYGTLKDAHHIGAIVRVAPLVFSVEGNTTVSTTFSRNGVAVDMKEPNPTQVVGYIHPRQAKAA